MITFLEREKTEAIRLFYDAKKDKFSLKDLEKAARREGKFNIGFHYIIHNDGRLEKGLQYNLFADYELEGYKNSIYVLITADHLTDAQRFTLDKLKNTLNLPIIDGD